MSSAHLRILVPIETPEFEHPLIELASSIATSPTDELHLIHVVGPSSAHSSPVSVNGGRNWQGLRVHGRNDGLRLYQVKGQHRHWFETFVMYIES